MSAPYIPSPFAAPVIAPQVGSSGAPPLAYVSNSQFAFAPTAIDTAHLVPGGAPGAQEQALADTLARASAWVNNYCFGADPASKGASLAASLSVEAAYVSIKAAELRLICDYKPVLEVVGVDIGISPGSVSSIGSQLAAMTRIGRRTIYVPMSPGMVLARVGDVGGSIPSSWMPGGHVYAVWSYVNGYPHTKLAANVAAGATTCTVMSTDGNGGLWGVYPASGSFPGTLMTVQDGANTESVYVQAITPGTTTTTLTTSAFVNDHTLPVAPDFLPFTAVPADVQQAAIFMAMMLIKTRGSRALVMPQTPGASPSRQAFAQAGALEDWDAATGILARYAVRLKAKN